MKTILRKQHLKLCSVMSQSFLVLKLPFWSSVVCNPAVWPPFAVVSINSREVYQTWAKQFVTIHSDKSFIHQSLCRIWCRCCIWTAESTSARWWGAVPSSPATTTTAPWFVSNAHLDASVTFQPVVCVGCETNLISLNSWRDRFNASRSLIYIETWCFSW